MKKKMYLIAALMLGLAITIVVVYSCKKDNTTTTSQAGLTASAIDEVQSSESQDAVASKVEDDAANNVDNLEANDFNTTAQKSDDLGCAKVTVDHPDTTYWPKVVTLIFDCKDTINGETFAQSGKIEIVVNSTGKPWRAHLTRQFTFTNYSVTTDSTTVNINGTRNMDRKSLTRTLSTDSLQATVVLVDTIYSNLTFEIYNTGVKTDSFKYTRNAAKSRTTTLHYIRIGKKRKWLPELLKDNVTLNGQITGVDAKGTSYSRVITKPLVAEYCTKWPHNIVITSGEITYTAGTSTATIAYSSGGANGCKTEISVTKNGVTKVLNRKLGKHFTKWW